MNKLNIYRTKTRNCRKENKPLFCAHLYLTKITRPYILKWIWEQTYSLCFKRALLILSCLLISDQMNKTETEHNSGTCDSEYCFFVSERFYELSI